ncbi:MAG TPA: hypothetical protein VFQ87_19285 [Bradyrhizobium sp.]|nr:hypothetical protein [Bradyrhizobium sp.]
MASLLFGVTPSRAADHPVYGPELEGFDYPYEVQRYSFTSQGGDVTMAYMDVKPQSPNGKTAVLLHGRNFCAATWETTIAALARAGYRVIAPDQIRLLQVEQARQLSNSAFSNSPATPMRC